MRGGTAPRANHVPVAAGTGLEKPIYVTEELKATARLLLLLRNETLMQ